jgi:hypothetical protein
MNSWQRKGTKHTVMVEALLIVHKKAMLTEGTLLRALQMSTHTSSKRDRHSERGRQGRIRCIFGLLTWKRLAYYHKCHIGVVAKKSSPLLKEMALQCARECEIPMCLKSTLVGGGQMVPGVIGAKECTCPPLRAMTCAMSLAIPRLLFLQHGIVCSQV